MDARQQGALAKLARRLDAHGLAFVLGGSGLLSALGLTVEVADLDVLLPAESHDALRTAAGEWWRGSRHGGDGLWRSDWLASLEVDGVPVDAVGGFAFYFEERLVRLPLRSSAAIDVDGARIPLCDPALWWVVYTAYKPAKAALLEGVVTPSERAGARAELGLGPASGL